MIEITETTIDEAAVLNSVRSNGAGACILFVGTTRQFTDGRETTKLVYECYREMAIKKLTELHDAACSKWPIESCSIVHRVGTVAIGESSIAVAVSTPHRVDSFAAAQWLMDTIKKEVPIWKQENWSDGPSEWIHPEKAQRAERE